MDNVVETIKKIYEFDSYFCQFYEHQCYLSFCFPKNIFHFIGKDPKRVCEGSFDPDVWICKYQKIHICGSGCFGDIKNSDGEFMCSISGQTKKMFMGEVPCRNPKDATDVNATVTQMVGSIINHKSTSMIKEKSRLRDKKYNDMFNRTQPPQSMEVLEFSTRSMSYNNNFKFMATMLNRIEELKLKDKSELWDIIKRKTPLKQKNGFSKYLHSHNLYNLLKTMPIHTYNLYDINKKITMFLSLDYMNNRQSIQEEIYKNLINTTMLILKMILPGIYRLQINFNELLEIQMRNYKKCAQYILKCKTMKSCVNEFKLFTILDIDKNWENMPCLIDWPTIDHYFYYARIILNIYIFVENSGNFTQHKKCRNALSHILGSIYLLKSGYKYDNQCVIPQDIYLNKPQILLSSNNLSKYLAKYTRRTRGNSIKFIKEVIDGAMKVITPKEFMELIFYI